MKKLYFEKNNTRTGYRPIGRYKKVYFNNSFGAPYFKWNGRRKYFDDIPRLTCPIMLEDNDEKTIVLGGYITLSNVCGVLVEIHPDGEMVRLWEEVPEDEFLPF